MAEILTPLPPHADMELVASVLEQCCLDEGLTIMQKGSLAKYPGCTHWHFKQGNQPGTLELTVWPATKSAWFIVRANRRAEWMDETVDRLQSIMAASLSS